MTETTFENEIRRTADGASEQLSGAVTSVKEKAQDIARRAADKLEETRGSAASGLASAATALHQKAESLPGGDVVHNAAHSTADKVAATADYLRTHALADVMTDLENTVRQNPGASLLAAVFAGFMVGRMVRDR